MFWTVPLSIIRSFSLYTQQRYMSHSLRAGSGWTTWTCSQAVSKPVWHIPLLCVQWKTPDDWHWNYLKHVEFYSKNKIEKLVHLVGFIIRIYNDARSPERQTTVRCHLSIKHPISFPSPVKFNNFYTAVFNLTVTPFQATKFVSLLSINSAYKIIFHSVLITNNYLYKLF